MRPPPKASRRMYSPSLTLPALTASARAMIECERSGWVKIKANKKDGVIKAAAIFGERADELIAILSLAVRKKCTVSELSREVFFHPSRGDRENPRKQESGEDEKNHSLVKKLRCGGVGELIFFDRRSTPPSPGDLGW